MDFSAPLGTSVNIQFQGTVTSSGPATGFGNAVAVAKRIDVAPGIPFTVSYAFGHGPSARGLTSGQGVFPGDQIMSVGSMGHSTGPHLHVQKSTGDPFTGKMQRPCVP
jgi:murein DD-endopeptidase MepM/ murein hydrolase activator NlpD